MAKKVLSIVLGTDITKVCEVSYKKNYQNKSIRIYRSITFPTPSGSIEDGFIKDKQLFGEELRSRLKAGKFKSDKVIFSVSSSKIANREIILPPTKEKKIMDIIKTGASDYFPIDIKDYIISYQILEKNTSERKEKLIQKQLDKKESKLIKVREKQEIRAAKKKSKTELIADKMERMEASVAQVLSIASENPTTDEKVFVGKKHIRLSVYAAPSTLVKNYYNFAKFMHLDIVSLDYAGNSSYQLIKRQVKRGTNVFVQLNEQDTLISILRDDVLILQRTVGYGVDSIVDAVLEQKYFPVKDYEEALKLLENTNLLTLLEERQEPKHPSLLQRQAEAAATREYNIVEAKQAMNDNRLFEAEKASKDNPSFEVERASNEGDEVAARRNIMDSLHFLTNSIVRMLDYYKSNHKNINVNTIYILGTGAHIQGIDRFFTTEIGIMNKKMEKLYLISARKKAIAYRKNPGEYIPCIGAVLKPIDFVPTEFTEKKQKRSAIIATVIFTLACLAGSLGTVYVGYLDYQIANKERLVLQEELAAMPQINSVQAEYEERLLQLQNLQEFDAMTQSNNDKINAVIKALEKNLPTQTVIHTMQFSRAGVSMSITASDSGVGANALVAKLLVQFKTIEYFDKVDVSGISVQDEGEVERITFSINCTYVE